MSGKVLGGIGAALALIIGACAGSSQAAQQPNDQQEVQRVSVDGGYDPRIYTKDAWQLGYCISAENDEAEKHEGDGDYGTGSYADLLATRPCTLTLAFDYGRLLEKYGLVGEKDHDVVWSVLSSKDSKFRDNVIRFSDGYAENFVNR